MASTDALLAPIKNTAFRMPVGPFFKTDGTVITTWAGMDSEISEDGAAYTDCTNEATEIGTSGTGYLDLTTGETNCDAFWIKVTITNTDAVPFFAYFATQRAGALLRSDVRELLGAAWLTPNTAGTPDVNVVQWNELNTVALPLTPTTAGRALDVSAAGNAGIDWSNIEAPTTAVNLSATNIDVDQVVASVSGAVGSVTGAVGSVVGSVGSVAGMTASDVGAIKTKTDFLPSATAGSTGGVLIAGSNAATTFATLDVTGAFTIGTDFVVTGDVDFLQALNITGAMNVGGALTITGNFAPAAILTGNVTASGAVAFQSTFAVTGATTLTGTVTASNASNNIVGIDVAKISGDSGAADNLETAYDDTAGAVRWLNIIDRGTAQSATGTTLVLRSAAAFANDELNGCLLVITGGTGAGQVREITDYVASSDTATVDTWTTTPSGTITYAVLPAVSAAGGGGLTEADVRNAVGLASANLDTQLANILAAASGGTGGANTFTITVTDGTDPLQNVSWGVYDNGGILVGVGTTDASGNGSGSADTGTYTVALVKGGYTFTPVTRTVTGNQTGTLTSADLEMTAAVTPSAPADPAKGTVYGYVKPTDGSTKAGYVASARLHRSDGRAGPIDIGGDLMSISIPQTDTTDSNGLFELELYGNAAMTPSGCFWEVTVANANFSANVTVVAGTSANLGTLIV